MHDYEETDKRSKIVLNQKNPAATRMKLPAVNNPDGGAAAPLLPKQKPPPKEREGASVAGAVSNVSTSIIGGGIMSIPATLKVLGVIPAFVSIVMVAVLADVSVEFLMRFTNSGESKTYAGVMYESFGRVGSVAVQICVMVSNFGCLTIYLIIIVSEPIMDDYEETDKRSKIVLYQKIAAATRMKSPAVNNPDGGAAAPLLPKLKLPSKERQGASVAGAVFNVSTSIIGGGIMSIPATLKVLGVIPAFVSIVTVAVLADVSVEFLMSFTNSGESKTYAGVMYESFGRVGSVAVQICVMLTNFGCLIIYLIIIGDVLSGNQLDGAGHLGVLQQWFGIYWWNTRAFALLLVIVFVLLPLVLFRRVESLRFSSAVSVLLAVVFVGICFVMAVFALLEGKTKRPRLVPQLDNGASFFNLFTAVPVIVTAFTFHFNVHPIAMELGKPADMAIAVKISLLLCAAIYFAVGIFGYILYGDSLMSDMLVNFDQNSGSAIGSLLNDVVRLSYALHLMLVFPLLNYSLRANIDEFLFPKKSPLVTDEKRFVALTLILLVCSYLAAIAIPNIWYFFQFIGSTSIVCLAFIFPSAIALRDVHGICTRKDRIMAAAMVVLAVITSAIAISTNLYNFIGAKL